MIGNIIMSSHAFYFGLTVDFFDDKSWSRWGSNPGPLAWKADMLTTTPPDLRYITSVFASEPSAQYYTLL